MKRLSRIAALLVTSWVAVAQAHGVAALCDQERKARETAGITPVDGPLCLASANPKSALIQAAAFSEDDLLGCRVALCMAAPGGPENLEECKPTLAKYKSLLRRGKTVPSCPLMWADGQGAGGVSHSVTHTGEVAKNKDSDAGASTGPVTSVTDEQANVVAELGRSAYSSYGIACNSVETMIEQMGQSEGVPRGGANYDWLQHGVSTTAFGDYDSQPDWWKASNPRYAEPWGRILPWFVAFEGEGNRTGAATVQIGRMSIQYFSIAQRQWVVLDRNKSFAVSGCQQGSSYYECPSMATQAGPEGYGTFPVGNGINGHGWFDMLQLPDPRDVQAITVSVEARLVGSNAATAEVLLDTGADLYPNQGPVPGVLPGAAESRLERLGPQWETVSMITLSDLIKGSGRGMSIAELRANPPSCARPS